MSPEKSLCHLWSPESPMVGALQSWDSGPVASGVVPELWVVSKDRCDLGGELVSLAIPVSVGRCVWLGAIE